MEQRRNEGTGETGDTRENPLTSGIVQHDSHLRESGVNRPGIEHGSARGGSVHLVIGMTTDLERTTKHKSFADPIKYSAATAVIGGSDGSRRVVGVGGVYLRDRSRREISGVTVSPATTPPATSQCWRLPRWNPPVTPGHVPGFHKWGSARSLQLFGGFCRESPVSPTLASPFTPNFTFIGSRDLVQRWRGRVEEQDGGRGVVGNCITTVQRGDGSVRFDHATCAVNSLAVLGIQSEARLALHLNTLSGGADLSLYAHDIIFRTRSDVSLCETCYPSLHANYHGGFSGITRDTRISGKDFCTGYAGLLGIVQEIFHRGIPGFRAERLAYSPPTNANRVQSPAGSPDFRKWESCRTIPLVGGFSRGSADSPAPSFRCCSILTSTTLLGSQDLDVKSRQISSLFHFLCGWSSRLTPPLHFCIRTFCGVAVVYPGHLHAYLLIAGDLTKFASSVTCRIDSTVLWTNMPVSAAHWLSAVTVEGDYWTTVLQGSVKHRVFPCLLTYLNTGTDCNSQNVSSVLETASFLLWLQHRCEATPFLTELHQNPSMLLATMPACTVGVGGNSGFLSSVVVIILWLRVMAFACLRRPDLLCLASVEYLQVGRRASEPRTATTMFAGAGMEDAWKNRGERFQGQSRQGYTAEGASAAERSARSPSTKANRIQSPAGSPDFRKWGSCQTMPLVGGFSRGSPVSLAPSFQRRSIVTSIPLVCSQYLAVKSRPNLFTQSSIADDGNSNRSSPGKGGGGAVGERPCPAGTWSIADSKRMEREGGRTFRVVLDDSRPPGRGVIAPGRPERVITS
ncbi:hypothetical protein PR048_031165 [Dryococelus australis]|uniref:Uncharacterized protein n=1 Tax=Dryococelus australis TaxID=614101 RepID=A0ABQ9G4H6_9NEOP|nr:hypothetical protein PR048_031165 [Dryococelus australis]